LISPQGKQISEDKDIVQHLNDYFSSVFTKEGLSNTPKAESIFPDPENSKNFDMKFDESDVIKALDTLRAEKAVGPDGLSPRLLKETKEFISYPLYLLFEKSFSESAVPGCNVKGPGTPRRWCGR